MKSIKIFTGLMPGIMLMAFTFGGDSFTIHLNNKQLIEHFVHSKKETPSLQLAPGEKGQLTVFYSECGKIGKARTIILKDDQQNVLKTWKYADALTDHKPMEISVSELQAHLKKEKSLSLVYQSREVTKETLLVTITAQKNVLTKN
ncbi:MAG: hypothetical protein KF803_14250 [Cyclobacteriaceae bacterium]|nr:hypothetical protein [Cyclobacteriaceae bacterium]